MQVVLSITVLTLCMCTIWGLVTKKALKPRHAAISLHHSSRLRETKSINNELFSLAHKLGWQKMRIILTALGDGGTGSHMCGFQIQTRLQRLIEVGFHDTSGSDPLL